MNTYQALKDASIVNFLYHIKFGTIPVEAEMVMGRHGPILLWVEMTWNLGGKLKSFFFCASLGASGLLRED